MPGDRPGGSLDRAAFSREPSQTHPHDQSVGATVWRRPASVQSHPTFHEREVGLEFDVCGVGGCVGWMAGCEGDSCRQPGTGGFAYSSKVQSQTAWLRSGAVARGGDRFPATRAGPPTRAFISGSWAARIRPWPARAVESSPRRSPQGCLRRHTGASCWRLGTADQRTRLPPSLGCVGPIGIRSTLMLVGAAGPRKTPRI